MNAEPLLYWIAEREAIRQRREAGRPAPWTSDPILQAYRFCNVRREDDRVTKWIADNIRRPYQQHPYLWFMLCIARQINWPETLAELIASPHWGSLDPPSDMFRPTDIGRLLEARGQRGEKTFTGAYIITAPQERGAKKSFFVAEQTLGKLWWHRGLIGDYFRNARSLREAHGALMNFSGWGPFLAYQAVVDMRFCPELLGSATDVGQWAAAGPGTIRGLNRLHERPVAAALGQQRALDEMLPLFEMIPRLTGVPIDFSDVPNVLCETDKYLRVKNGEGKPRALYVAGRGC